MSVGRPGDSATGDAAYEEAERQIGTLEDVTTSGELRRSRALRRIGIVSMVVFVGAAAIGWLGVRTSTATTQTDGASLSVTHPTVTRPGLAAPFAVSVDSSVSLPRVIHVVVDADFFTHLDFQNVYPQPESVSEMNGRLNFAFNSGQDDNFECFFDIRTGPDQQLESASYQVTVATRSADLATNFSVFILP